MWRGKVDAHRINLLTEHLALIPDSRVFALRGGASELQGWNAQAVLTARVHNLIAGLVAGLSKDVKISDLLIEYPGAKAAAEAEQPKTLADLMHGTSLADFFVG
ncbi:hypothetical protein [Microbacterium sp. VKM Ac-2923]|uniref:hypothetical protein n=1 Tax=Microbacterium sp. VKM Ac-2923 TaxID=2929476 RepID=UPI001FB2C820|nr:hypothetical protein [Microbacterium sp. VKM Ac-2923]MCJ1709225.1 hypothetical protein [Microbacterium sp. VKM Ac-2923]